MSTLTPLDQAMQIWRTDASKGREFYNLFLNSNLFVPAHHVGGPQQVERAAWSNESFAPMFIEVNGRKYLPIFDDLSKLKTWAKQELKYIRMQGGALIQSVGHEFHCVLNPGTTYSKEFTSAELKSLHDVMTPPAQQKNIPEGTPMLIGEPSKIPPALQIALPNTLKSFFKIRAAFLAQVMYELPGEKPHLVLLLSIDDPTPELLKQVQTTVSDLVRRALGPAEPLDMVLDDGSEYPQVIKRSVKPMFSK